MHDNCFLGTILFDILNEGVFMNVLRVLVLDLKLTDLSRSAGVMWRGLPEDQKQVCC